MASISKRRTTKGEWRWDVRWRVDGKPKERAFRRAKDAETFKRQVESDELKGLTIDPSRGRIPFGEYAEGWLATRRRVDGRALAPRTVELYRYMLEPLAPSRVRHRCLDQHPHRAGPALARHDWPKTAARSQAAKAYRLLGVILNTAVEDERITRNPCILRGAGTERTKERPFVDAEVVLRLADTIDERYRALVLLAGFGGLRLGELLALRTPAPRPRYRAQLRVEVQAVELKDGTRLVTAPKTDAGTRRGLPAGGRDPGPARPSATSTGRDQPACSSPVPCLTVYAGRRSIRSGIWPARRSATRSSTSTTFATPPARSAAQTGATLREVMARLGHASPAAAQRYQHAAERRDRVIAEALDVILDAAEQSRKAANGPGPRDGRGMEPELDPLSGGAIYPKVGPDQHFLRERATRIELAFSAWEADVLPLNYARNGPVRYRGRDAGVPIGGPRSPPLPFGG